MSAVSAVSAKSAVSAGTHLRIGLLLGMEQVAALHAALLNAPAAEPLVVDLEGGERLHGAAFQLLAVLVRDRAVTGLTTTFINATPAIEALMGLAGLADLLPAAAEAAAA